jgi:hypothetical protein
VPARRSASTDRRSNSGPATCPGADSASATTGKASAAAAIVPMRGRGRRRGAGAGMDEQEQADVRASRLERDHDRDGDPGYGRQNISQAVGERSVNSPSDQEHGRQQVDSTFRNATRRGRTTRGRGRDNPDARLSRRHGRRDRQQAGARISAATTCSRGPRSSADSRSKEARQLHSSRTVVRTPKPARGKVARGAGSGRHRRSAPRARRAAGRRRQAGSDRGRLRDRVADPRQRHFSRKLARLSSSQRTLRPFIEAPRPVRTIETDRRRHEGRSAVRIEPTAFGASRIVPRERRFQPHRERSRVLEPSRRPEARRR